MFFIRNLQFAALLAGLIFGGCTKIAPRGGNAEIVGGTEKISERIRLAQVQAIDALRTIEQGERLDLLCSPVFCDPSWGVCEHLSPLAQESRATLLRGSLWDTANLAATISFLERATFRVEHDLTHNGEIADAVVESNNQVRFDFDRAKTKTIAELVMNWIHEAGHTFIQSGLSSLIEDSSRMAEDFLGSQFLSAQGACVAAHYSTLSCQVQGCFQDIQQLSVPDLQGSWMFGSDPVTVFQTGAFLRFVNEFGSETQGSFLSSYRVSAEDWGPLGASIPEDGSEIRWENGTTWKKVPDLGGAWQMDGQPTSITQDDFSLVFTNEHGDVAFGRFNSPTQIEASDWEELKGALNKAGDTIVWANGTIWTR